MRQASSASICERPGVLKRSDPDAGAALERRAEERLADAWFEQARTDERTLYVLMREGAALVRTTTDGASAVVLVSASDARVVATDDADRVVLLGWFRGRRCVLVDLPAALAVAGEGERFAELRPLAAELAADETELIASARALNLWRIGHRHCGRCGAVMRSVRAGHARHCASCGTLVFPRIDPAVIVLVHDDAHVLLGRQSTWPPGRFSALAGFVEPGETLEHAVRREVHEETGIDVRDIDYHSSQPWPFPASLMLGFSATATPAPPVLRDGELEEARWFSCGELRSGAVLLPPAPTIARRLIDDWLACAR